MADNSKDNIKASKETLAFLKSYIKTQGDYNDIVSQSVSNLQRLNKELEKQGDFISDTISGQLSFNKLNEKLLESKKKQKLAQQNLKDLTKNISDEAKANAESLIDNINKKVKAEQLYHAAVRSGNKNQIQAADRLISDLESKISLQEQSLNVEELEYAAALKMAQARKQATEDIAEQITLKSKLKAYGETLSPIAKGALGAITGKGEGFGSLIDKSIDMLKMIPGIGGAIGGLLGGMKALFDFIVEIEDRTVKFGRNLGYSRDQSFEISKQFANIATGSGKLLLTTENMMEVQTDLSQQLGINNILTAEMLDTQIELKKIMGLSADEMGSLAQASIISGKSQKEVVTGVLGQVANLKQATGIAFNYKQIIGEASKLGGVLGLQFAKYPEKLAKSLVITKALGMDLAKVDQIAGSLLDFESTIQNQLEAQLITGKDINLSKAQTLALDGDTAGVAMALSEELQKVGDFTKLRRFEQDAIAKAVGMERNEVADLLKNQEILTKLSATDIKDAQKKLEILQKQGASREKLVGLLGEEAYANLTGLSAQEKMAALIDKVKGALQDFLTKSGVVEWVTGLIQKLTNPDNVKGLINMIKNGVAIVADMIQAIAYSLLTVAQAFTFDDAKDKKLADLQEKLGEQSMGDKIRSLGTEKNFVGGVKQMEDFVIKPLPQDTITSNGVTVQGGTRLGRTDEMVDLLKQILSETKQGKVMSFNIDGAPVAAAVARNASLTPAASNLGPRPLR